jgi:hypothetical protein
MVLPVMKSEMDDKAIQELCAFSSEALRQTNNESIMKSGLEAIGDLVRTFPAMMGRHVPSILTYIIECLNNPNLIKGNRIHIFATIGDIAIGAPANVKNEFDSILRLYNFAFDAVVQMFNNFVSHWLSTDRFGDHRLRRTDANCCC